MGYLHNGQCLPTFNDALDVFISENGNKSVHMGGVDYFVVFQSLGSVQGEVVWAAYAPILGSWSLLHQYASFPSCVDGSSPYRFVATADDYAAVSAIFGVVFTAACIIWGAKQLYNLLRNRPES